MLPGLRILFATTILAISILVFGLGAAALLRAAHEEFASLTLSRPTQQPVLTPFTPQVPRLETTPVLAMLRIEAPGGTKPLPEALRRDTTPEYRPPLQASLAPPADDTVVQESNNPVTDGAEATASAPVLDSATAPNAPASVSTPVEEANAPDVTTPDVQESKVVEPASAKPELKATDPKATELLPIDVASHANPSPTEATEPLSTVTSIERSSEATAFAVEPRPVVKKVRRPSARAIALRREAARVRAEARTRAKQLQQQQQAFPLFGG